MFALARMLRALLVVFPLFSVWAEEHPVVPENLPEAATIGADQVLAMVDSGSVLILDTRKSSDCILGSIPGAINCAISSSHHRLDPAEIDLAVTELKSCAKAMGADRAKPVVVFCNGDHCWRSAKAALALKRLGFTKILWYRLGMNDWKAKGLPME